jgi:dethiobiotin synthetase
VKGLFVTGTDTGVGKTFVSCALIRAARAAGHRVFAFKPIETGCPAGEWGEDQRALAAASESVLRGTYRLALPAAPWVAAQAEGVEIDLGRIAADLAGAAGHDRVLVEAAGGWRVPITRTADTGDLACLCGLPVLIVARAGLGTINHTLLTIEAIERDGLALAGVVLSVRPEDDVEFARSNAAQIAGRSRTLVHCLPNLPDL